MTPIRRCRAPLLPASLLILFAALLPFTAGAVTVDGLYRAEVEVAGKGNEARTGGFRRALEQVLVKVSGSSAVRSNPDAEEVLASPERFVQQFSYEALEDADTEAPAASGEQDEEAEAPTHRLLVQFAESRVERALSERGIVIWGEQRPEILVWLAVDDGDERRIVSSDDGSEAREQLVERARERGLPTMLPLMDMEDRARVEFVDIQGGFLEAVEEASERYRPTALLIGHVRPRGSDWAGSWNLTGVGERKAWDSAAGDLRAAVAVGVDGVTDRVAGAFAGRGEEERELRLRVTEVEGLDGYARVSEYLASLVRVRRAEVAQLHPREVIFRVIMNGRVADLERAITLGSTLSRVRSDDGEPSGAAAEFGRDLAVPLDGEGEGDGAPASREPVDLTFRLVS